MSCFIGSVVEVTGSSHDRAVMDGGNARVKDEMEEEAGMGAV